MNSDISTDFFLVYISSDTFVWHFFWHPFPTHLLTFFVTLFLTFFSSRFSLTLLLTFLLTYFSTIFSDVSSDILVWHFHIFWRPFLTYLLAFFWHIFIHPAISTDFFLVYISSDIFVWHIFWHPFLTYLLTFFVTLFLTFFSYIFSDIAIDISSDILSDSLFWHIFWHSFCPSVSRFHPNYPLLLVPSPGSGSSSDHCDLSSQTDSNWLSLCLIQNNFRGPGVSRRCPVRSRAPRVRSGVAQSAPELPGWGPALPSPLQSSPVEVRRCPLQSGARCWGPALPTALWRSRLTSGDIWRRGWRGCLQRWGKRRKEEGRKGRHHT